MKKQTIISTTKLRLDDELSIIHVTWNDEDALNIWNVKARDLTRGVPLLSYELGLLFPKINRAFQSDEQNDAAADEIAFFSLVGTDPTIRVAHVDGYTIRIEPRFDMNAPISHVGWTWTISYASTRKMVTGHTNTVSEAEVESSVLLNAALDKYAPRVRLCGAQTRSIA